MKDINPKTEINRSINFPTTVATIGRIVPWIDVKESCLFYTKILETGFLHRSLVLKRRLINRNKGDLRLHRSLVLKRRLINRNKGDLGKVASA
ncbi:MAG TPA: hypothetical protein DDW76_30875 [Cyanobacteria bacterium UBA11369]|nr:hypothetical protein [Cyanobacteria bacterium UBA11371]HBE35439.1 hypothetical protein [Cyanobacteria bacterium UBA11368]HBE53049.1 hypothetical protein [Cyanobacteria bacterium UBA11369]